MVLDMSIVTDGLLIAICLTAAFYCHVLSRRLRDFSDTGTGVGLQIKQMSETLDETRVAIRETRDNARSASDRLTKDLAQARKLSADLNQVIARAEAKLDEWSRVSTAPAPVASRESDPPSDVKKDVPVENADVGEPTTEELEDDELDEEVDLNAMRGDPQLGFLPELDEADEADAAIKSGHEPESSEENDEEDDSLLKVERMTI